MLSVPLCSLHKSRLYQNVLKRFHTENPGTKTAAAFPSRKTPSAAVHKHRPQQALPPPAALHLPFRWKFWKPQTPETRQRPQKFPKTTEHIKSGSKATPDAFARFSEIQKKYFLSFYTSPLISVNSFRFNDTTPPGFRTASDTPGTFGTVLHDFLFRQFYDFCP